MFDLGTQELIVIFIVAFLVFGPKKLPELGRTLGKGIRELKSALRGVKESLEEASEEVTEEIKIAKSDVESAINKGIDSQFTFTGKKKDVLKESGTDQDKSSAENGQEESSAGEEEKEKTEPDRDE
jgi:TatA/E family protein of Tat protein translocase